MIPFVKLHGIGNDFVLLDGIARPEGFGDLPALAQTLCDRRFGVGGDGLVLVERAESAPFRMRMLNPDGSEAEQCGNALRCAVRFVQEEGYLTESAATFETAGRPFPVSLESDGRVSVDMGEPQWLPAEIGMSGPLPAPTVEGFPAVAVGMGNPHLVLFVADVASIALDTIGPKLEHHPLFPNRTNVHFVSVESPERLVQRTWERGAGATLACGSGACASAAAALRTGRTGPAVDVVLPGGTLRILTQDDGRIHMVGPARRVFSGRWG